jgi:c-di-GMP-binding flagellar brake protein YcgR
MKVYIINEEEKVAFPAAVTNLSGGGCLLNLSKDCNAKLEVGDKLILNFSSTDLGIVDVQAKLVRINASGVAFQFIINDKNEREAIVRYVLKRELDSAT